MYAEPRTSAQKIRWKVLVPDRIGARMVIAAKVFQDSGKYFRIRVERITIADMQTTEVGHQGTHVNPDPPPHAIGICMTV